MTGVIIKGVGGIYTVYASGKLYNCTARGVMRVKHIKPLIGDKVILSDIDETKETGVIDKLCPRSNSLIRPAVANVDAIALVVAAVNPEPDLMMVDKLMVNAAILHIPVVLIVNKADQSQVKAEQIQEQYKNSLPVFITAMDRECESIKSYMKGKCTVLAGQSGVGKSTLLNRLIGESRMATGELSEKLNRGRHTTRHSEIFLMPSEGLLIDSPGFSLYDVDTILPGDLQKFYPEVYNGEGNCKFPDCSHTGEPQCFVQQLVEEGLFNPQRYNRYCKIYKELQIRDKNKYR